MRRAVARGRVFSQSYSTDRRYGRLSLKAVALFPLMWANADDQGRLSGDHEEIKYAVCPNIDHITKADIPELLREMEDNDLIKVYNTHKTKAMQLLDWWEEAGAKLQWARPSEYDPPEGWEDRLRYKERPEGPVITENWTPKDKIRNTLTKEMKLAILERDNYTCRYCGATRDVGVDIEVAHISPVRDGGSNDEDNLVAACHRCNMQELGRPPDAPPSQQASQSGDRSEQRESNKEKSETEIEIGDRRGRRIRNKPGQPGGRPGEPSPSPTGLSLQEKGVYETLKENYHMRWGQVHAENPEKIIPRPLQAKAGAQLRDLAIELSAAGGCPADTIKQAFDEACGQHKYHISYVRAILLDWMGVERIRAP